MLENFTAYAQSQKTTGLLVIQNGRTLIEENWPLPPGSEAFAAMLVRGANAQGVLLEDVASQQKSFLSVLAAMAIERGLLDIDKPVSAFHGEGWSKASPEQERAITVRHLLEMTSGLSDQLTYEAAPGTRFFYNTPAYARLHAVVEKAGGEPLDALTAKWLTGPLQMTDSAWKPRPAEVARSSGNAWSMVTAPRDVAKFGAFILSDGKTADGKQLLSPQSLAAMLAPTQTNPAYARLWWRNDSDQSIDVTGARIEGPLFPDAPRDTLLALGAAGRVIAIMPSHSLIVVRLGQQPEDPNFRTEFWKHLMAAIA